MRAFVCPVCPVCRSLLSFEDLDCVTCGTHLAFDRASARMVVAAWVVDGPPTDLPVRNADALDGVPADRPISFDALIDTWLPFSFVHDTVTAAAPVNA